MIRTNCYLVADEVTREAVIIDPGDDFARIQAECEKNNLRPVAVLLTHGHFDHMMAAAAVRDAYGIPVYATQAEKELLGDPNANGSYLIRKAYTFAADHGLDDNQRLFGMQVIATPGHTAGSVCFYSQARSVLFSGDTLFKDNFGRTDLPTGSLQTLSHSIKNRLFTLADETVVYPGHGPSTTIGYERKHNLIWTYPTHS
jgi:glyoxylase-like metal-dependent hydrolase (beta-lactamase superfamily II)